VSEVKAAAGPAPGTSRELPTGRILYRAETGPFVVVRHDRSGAFCVVEDGWTNQSRVAGPFDPNDVLRAWRIANVRVPEGCERGPWRWGIGLLALAPPPFRADEWHRFDPAWLPPSVSRYSASDCDRVVNETCCAPPHDEPHVRWAALPEAYDLRDLQGLVQLRFPDANGAGDSAGILEREWNAHPVGSGVLARSASLGRGFFVVDLAGPASPTSTTPEANM
jgi:hypothetical protein